MHACMQHSSNDLDSDVMNNFIYLESLFLVCGGIATLAAFFLLVDLWFLDGGHYWVLSRLQGRPMCGRA